MELFWPTNSKNFFSLLKFSFHNPVHIFSCDISSVCRLKYPYSCFSSHFCFQVFVVLFVLMLSVLLFAAVIRLCTFWCSPRVVVLMHLCNLQYWQVFFLHIFLTYIVCLYHPSDVRPCALSSTFLSFGLFVRVPLLSILRIVTCILQERLLRCLFIWWDFSLGSRSFIVRLFSYFFISPLVW